MTCTNGIAWQPRLGGSGWPAFAAAAALLALLAPLARAGDGVTRVAPGDLLRISVLEAPSLDREAGIDADGRIVLPKLGGVIVAGLDVDGVMARIEAALAEADIVRDPTVTVEFAAYRPFYVGGSVANPGAVPFAPGLTVRHALILAGGIAPLAGAEPLTTADLLDLKARWQANAYALTATKSTIARLEAELAETGSPDFTALETQALDPATVSSLLDLNAGLYGDSVEARQSDEAHFTAGIDLADLEIDVLGRQAEIARANQDLHQERIDQTRALVKKGLISATTLRELERESGLISSGLLETEAYAARARQTKESIRHERQQAEIGRRIEIRSELAQAVTERMRLEAESGVLGAALIAAGIGIGTGGSAEALRPDPRITIFRAGPGGTVAMPADPETAVLPGDVLDVALPLTEERQG